MTLQTSRIVIADSSCFILLFKIGGLNLLKELFDEIITTKEVQKECGDIIPEWVITKSSEDKYRQKLLEVNLGSGESSAIALAIEIPESLLVLDDYKARQIAKRIGLRITGTLGIIIHAKAEGHIDSVSSLIEKIQQTNFRLSEDLIRMIKTTAGEE